MLDSLERRALMCASHSAAEEAELLAGLTPAVADHSANWYKPVAISDAATDGSASGDADPTWTTNAAGLPLLTQRADGQGLKIFLDFDGYNTDTPFSRDADGTTFNAEEQKIIYDTWRDIVSFYSMLNVNVTTVQPPTGGSNPVFVWQRISNSISGGAAYVGWLTNNSSQGWTGSENAVSRHSGIAHEIAHQLGLSHQAEYDMYGTKTEEYTDGFSNRDRAVIGVDYSENVRGWLYGRNSDNAANLVDDLQSMANTVKSKIGGDGYRPDDFGNSIATATTLGTGSGIVPGVIERLTDSDYFKFTVTNAGAYQLAATPTYESAASPKLELMDSTGTVIAGRDDADQRNWNYNNQEFSLNLAPGTYYLRVAGGGDQSEQGEYVVTASPLIGSNWAATDVGGSSMYRGGTAAYNPDTGVLTQLGGGTDIWNQSDQFAFTYTTLTGDGSITARVDSLDNIGFHTKAGVMIRQSLAANSAHAFMGIKPSVTLDPIARSSSGGTAFNVGSSVASTNRWVRLTRVGNTFTLYSSGDGQNWTTVGSTNIAMSGQVYIGLATSAWSSRAQAYSTFSNISLTGNVAADPTTNFNTLASPVISAITTATGASTGINVAWSAVEDAAGYVLERSVDGVTYSTIASLGSSVLSYLDGNLFGSMRYFYRVSATDSTAKRSAPSTPRTIINKPAAPKNPDSGYAKPFITPSTTQIYLNWADVQGDEGYRVERSSNGGLSYTFVANTPVNATGYNDGNLTANTSYTYRVTPITSIGDGVAGSLLINAVTQLTAPANFHFVSINPTTISLAWNDSANETGYRLQRSTDRSTWTTISTLAANTTSANDSGLSPVTSYYYRLVAFNTQIDSGESIIFAATPSSAALPAGWTSGDIGAASGQGSTGLSGSTWTVIGSGNDIYDSADAFQYARRVVLGDGSITVRVASFENTQDYTKAGVMFRAGTDAGSPNVNVAYTPNGGIEFNSRGSTNGGTATNVRVNVTAPVWLKLVRTGNVFTGSYSTDNVTWTALGSVTVAMPTSALMGLAVTSHNTQKLAKATFDNVTTTGVSGGNVAPTITVAAKANPSPVFGKSTILNVIADDDAGTAGLTYTWSTAGKPSTAAAPTFSVNGTNGASTTVATFSAAGSYLMKVTVTDAGGLSVTSSVIVSVQATSTTISIVPGSSSPVSPGGTQTFIAEVRDQFGNLLNSSAAAWSATEGSINSSGVWTAPMTPGSATITATSGSLSATRIVQTALVATASSFDVNAAQQQLSFTFNGDLGTSLSASDIVLQQIGLDGTTVLATIDPATMSVSFDSGADVATVTFPALNNGMLADGNYRATIRSGSAADGPSGILLGEDATLDFYVLAGDIDRDRDVDFDDLLTLSKSYNSTGRTYAQGNVNYSADGLVGFDDLLALAKNYGGKLAAPATPVAASAAPQSASVTSTKSTRSRVATQVL